MPRIKMPGRSGWQSWVPCAEPVRHCARGPPEDIKVWNTASPDWLTTTSAVDLKPGGKFPSRMESKDGSFAFDFAGEYTNIVHLQLIEYAFGDLLVPLSPTMRRLAARNLEVAREFFAPLVPDAAVEAMQAEAVKAAAKPAKRVAKRGRA